MAGSLLPIPPSMRTLHPLLLGLCCLTVGLVGCGSDKLLDGSSADELRVSVANVQQAVADGRCDEARAAADEGLSRVDRLPSSVDSALVDNLRTGFERLQATIASDCQGETTTAETLPPTETEPPPTTTTEEAPPTETVPETTTEEPPPATTDETVPGTGTGTDDGTGTGTDDESGGTSPGGVDGPQGVPRTKNGIRDTARELSDRARRAVEGAIDRVRGKDR